MTFTFDKELKLAHFILVGSRWEELKETTEEPFMRELAEHYLEKLRETRKTTGDDRNDRI